MHFGEELRNEVYARCAEMHFLKSSRNLLAEPEDALAVPAPKAACSAGARHGEGSAPGG